MIKIRIERDETIKEKNQCRLEERSLVLVGGCDVEDPKRVRLEEESRKSKPRRRGAHLRIPDGRFVENRTPECGVRFHARISSSTMGSRKSPRIVQNSRDVDRPVTIKARVIEKFFSFWEASASFQAERFFCSGLSYRSAGDLACKRPIIVFFYSFYFIPYLLCLRPPRDFLFF
jgi:hypothetical protein